jgi:glycine/D-amino acid oxidase-like deaminating enzyme
VSARPRIGVLGGGLIGAAITYSLSQRRVDVDLFEAGRPAGGTSRTSFAWINAQSTVDQTYFRLRLEAMEAYRALPERLQLAMGLRWGGSLTFNGPAEALEGAIARLRSWGHPVRGVDAREFRALEPALCNPPSLALYNDSDGTVETRRATFALLSAARDHGARLHFNARGRLVARNGRIDSVALADAVFRCDAVVLATGADTDTLLRTVGMSLPITSETDTLVYLLARGRTLSRVLNAPTFHARQQLDGRVVLGSDVAAERCDSSEDVSGRLTRRFAAELDPSIPMLGYATRRSRRVVPRDGMPVLGRAAGISNLYIAVTHSGVTLAPLIAQIAAKEVLDGADSGLSRQFRPERFLASPPPSHP